LAAGCTDLWRAVDKHGRTLDVLLQAHQDPAAAERLFRRLLLLTGDTAPARITTGTLGSYAAAIARLPELAGTAHPQVRSAMRCGNRVEQAHQPTRNCERIRRRFTSAASAQRFLDAGDRVGNLFRQDLHQLSAATYRATTRERVATSGAVAGLHAA
jgi:putative transposase